MRISLRLIVSLVVGVTLLSILFAVFQVKAEKRGLRKRIGESRRDRGRKFGRQGGASAGFALAQTLAGGRNRVWESRALEGNCDIQQGRRQPGQNPWL